MKNNKNGISKIIAALAITCLHAFSVNAEVKMHRGNSDTNSFPGGIWDFNYTAKWLVEGSTTPAVWDSNSDTALIVNTTTAWRNLEITIDDTYGNVGAAGIVITNNLKEWQYNKFIGDSLHIGSEGVTVYDDNPNTFVTFECPVVLTDAQTWHNPKLRQMDVSGTVTASGVVSSEAGKDTPVTFSGFNRIDPSLKGMSVERPAFAFKNDNTYTGDTIINSGGVLYLLFSNDFPGSKIDPESDLILSGGGLAITGKAQVFTQSVSRLVIKAGENFIGGKNADAVFDCGEIVREGIGGTMTFPVSWAGGTTAYADNTNTDGILGGWALLNDGAFAAMNISTRMVGQVSTAQRWNTDSWGNNQHVVVMGGGVRTAGDVSPYSVRYQAGQPAFTNDFADAVLTIKSGGLAVNNTALCKLENGILRSGFETGELFVFTAGLFEISSKIEDNGDTPFTLVKAQSGTLVLSGELAFTGDIYLNGGKLVLTGDGAEIESEIHQSGGTTLALSNGANVKCNGDGRVLGGNLELGSGSKLNMEICGKTSGGDLIVPLTLPNRFGTFNVTADMENPVELILDVAPGADIKRGNYPLIRWTDATTVSGLDVDLFAFDVHNTIQGEIVAVENGIDFVVTSVARGALITVR